ncbi:hypothetical protein L0663_01635 [Dyadobacter sp. CY107]|uniref:hypothetical protein n=1 Tax=Dyadobacter fanqingshengii TaxID=2906443 RepID=UPI001F3C5F23|nr:hypothetical protein [Dyadobacter fanqingshengii]MCF2502066.1 hypothetical protein [Dyadobacter fanqingshengii]
MAARTDAHLCHCVCSGHGYTGMTGIRTKVPVTYIQQFRDRQQAGFLDVVQPIQKGKMLGWSESVLDLALWVEYADYNVRHFQELGLKIADHMYALIPAISFRPSVQTVIRANYRYERHTDLLRNPASQTADFQFGFSTYL